MKVKLLNSFSKFNVSSSYSRERTGSSLVKKLSKFLTSVLDCCEKKNSKTGLMTKMIKAKFSD